jgi:hypothetical protein
MRAVGRPERQMSVTAQRRFGTEIWRVMATRSTQRLPRYGASRRWSRVGAPSVYERPAVEGAV